MTISEDERARRRQARLGCVMSQETRDKIRRKLAGVKRGPMSDAAKARISEGQKARFRRQKG